ncbi:MAG: UDP-N-acetylglucosamine 2-epimerase (non-hydrolyzing) [Candidatus Omnitrophica bacterium]|nr:UDP-N-acetylglucosamine 2-epimerase (non-hydrolyzing) [Candidatus Omnitrophota bacterium]MDD5652705.1 UDP-N-acetylglucosamine 2-epimerase (non-hydrolyzing) [Candidatus Omnitrophota bacterium]
MKSKKRRKFISIVGARPNFIKIAPVLKNLKAYKGIDSLLLHTGQHYDKEMSKIFFDDLKLPKPDIYLDAGGRGGKNKEITKMMSSLECVLSQEKPDLVIVVGDVNSTVAGAIVASRLSIPIAHIESGLRSFDLSMPEEINRIVTDSLSNLLFTPSREANENLYREGIRRNKVHYVGNVMIDTLTSFRRQINSNTRALRVLGINERQYAMLTLHRPSNVDKPEDLRKIIEAISFIQDKVKIIFPVHPRTMSSLEKFNFSKSLARKKNIRLVPPMGYLDFLTLINKSLFVITDSGGIQEETTILGVPCLTVRKNTERPVTVAEGTNTIVGTDPKEIIKESQKILEGKGKAGRIPELWDGNAAKRIVEILVN